MLQSMLVMHNFLLDLMVSYSGLIPLDTGCYEWNLEFKKRNLPCDAPVYRLNNVSHLKDATSYLYTAVSGLGRWPRLSSSSVGFLLGIGCFNGLTKWLRSHFVGFLVGIGCFNRLTKWLRARFGHSERSMIGTTRATRKIKGIIPSLPLKNSRIPFLPSKTCLSLNCYHR